PLSESTHLLPSTSGLCDHHLSRLDDGSDGTPPFNPISSALRFVITDSIRLSPTRTVMCKHVTPLNFFDGALQMIPGAERHRTSPWLASMHFSMTARRRRVNHS